MTNYEERQLVQKNKDRREGQIHIGVIFLGLMCMIFGMTKCTSETKEYTECGIVIAVYEAGVTTGGKYPRTESQRFIDVKYPDRYEQIKVTTDTWYNAKKDKNICFGGKTQPAAWIIILSGISAVVFFVATLTFLFCYNDYFYE